MSEEKGWEQLNREAAEIEKENERRAKEAAEKAQREREQGNDG